MTKPFAGAGQKEAAPKTTRGAVNVKPIRVTPKLGQPRERSLGRVTFANIKIETPEELTILDQRIRTTVKYLSIKAAKSQEDGNEAKCVAYFR